MTTEGHLSAGFGSVPVGYSGSLQGSSADTRGYRYCVGGALEQQRFSLVLETDLLEDLFWSLEMSLNLLRGACREKSFTSPLKQQYKAQKLLWIRML